MNMEKSILEKLSKAFSIADKTRFSTDEYDEEELVKVLINHKYTYWKYRDMKVVDGVKQYKGYVVVFKK